MVWTTGLNKLATDKLIFIMRYIFTSELIKMIVNIVNKNCAKNAGA